MAYKKYIQRNGKLYGPYIYHSKRVDGKVISEYYGNEAENKVDISNSKKHNYKKFLFIIGGVFLLAFLIYFIAFSNKGISGNAGLKLDSSYQEGKPLEGVLTFSVNEGELIPENSKVVFENSGSAQEFILSNIVQETPSEGKYYVYGKDITGEGLGYGIEGQRTIYPEVGFTLQIYTESSSETTTEPAVENTTESVVEPTNESTTTESTTIVIPETTEQVATIESTNQDNSTSSITGNVVKSSGGFFASIFGIIGRVTMNLENEVNGIVSKDKPFIYELKEGETVELKPKSVNVDGEEQNDNLVSLKIENGKAIVTTDYSENQKGYGPSYTGNKEKTISLDLSNLNLVLQQGNLTIKLVYNGEDIIQLSTTLKEGETISNETVINVNDTTIETNESIIETNSTASEEVNFSFSDVGNSLTSEEKGILIDKFGNITLETTKSELFKGRIIVGYNFHNYSVEYSYDSSLSKEVLDMQMGNDRITFLKDIANAISKKETSSEKLQGFNESYNF